MPIFHPVLSNNTAGDYVERCFTQVYVPKIPSAFIGDKVLNQTEVPPEILSLRDARGTSWTTDGKCR
jgi:hypothetical protein